MLGSFFDLENGGDVFLWNVGWLSKDYIREGRIFCVPVWSTKENSVTCVSLARLLVVSVSAGRCSTAPVGIPSRGYVLQFLYR
jgi:hypothetical protein